MYDIIGLYVNMHFLTNSRILMHELWRISKFKSREYTISVKWCVRDCIWPNTAV